MSVADWGLTRERSSMRKLHLACSLLTAMALSLGAVGCAEQGKPAATGDAKPAAKAEGGGSTLGGGAEVPAAAEKPAEAEKPAAAEEKKDAAPAEEKKEAAPAEAKPEEKKE